MCRAISFYWFVTHILCIIHSSFQCKKGFEIVKDLLEVYPQAATIPDSDGDLPLHLCLFTGKTWDTGIKEVLEADPDSNLMQDRKSHLFPFMIAASKHDIDEAPLHLQALFTGQHKRELSIKKQMALSRLTTVCSVSGTWWHSKIIER